MTNPSRLSFVTALTASVAATAAAQPPTGDATVGASAATGTQQGAPPPPVPAAQSTEETSDYPVRLVSRPIQLRRGMIRADARYQDLMFGVGEPPILNLHQLGIGVAFGVGDQLELAVSHVRSPGTDDLLESGFGLNFASRDGVRGGDTEFSDIALRGRYAAVQSSDFDLSVEVGATLPVLTDNLTIIAGAPVRARLAEHFALDLEPHFTFVFRTNPAAGEDDIDFAFSLPVAGVLSLGERMFLAGRSGMVWALTDDAGLFEAISFPLYAEFGASLGRDDTPLCDLSVEAGFPFFLQPGANDAAETSVLVVRAKASFTFSVR